MLAWAMIVIQVALAAAALHMLRWHVLPSLTRLPQRELILDVWAPVAIVLPLVCSVVWPGHSVRGAGWPGLGGPVVCGLIALATAAMVRSDNMGDQAPIEESLPRSASVMATVAGIILLLLGAAHVMHIMVGQIAFAMAAVVLWVNTPDMPRPGNVADQHPRAWLGMIVVVFCACVMGAAAFFVDEPLRMLSASVTLAYAGAALVLTAMHAGGIACMRIGLWAAVVGVLGSLGALSIMHMLPQALRFVLNLEPADVRFVAFGFGTYAFEAAILLVLPLTMLTVLRLPRPGRRAAGIVVLAATAALAVWRLTGM